MRRATVLIPATLLAVLLTASPASAKLNGEGLVEANDQIITFSSFALIGGIVVIMCAGTAIQMLLERKKKKRKAGIPPPSDRAF